ncbi:MAG: aspartate-semialdehyde dehydrogenase [unclassified Hahellaceae]|nr:aspartate-semialdehyde dehydrogenase [Hahellaceae bacterium]|tara:strand:+ start:63209 stop:64327 length:1119 start_codon:yes stop_codon:yes gene_type:complete
MDEVMKQKVGLVGWRGMVGSVLMSRLEACGDLDAIDACYFSTSQGGEAGPDGRPLLDATDIRALAEMDIVVSCQGGDYTKQVFKDLRASGWDGYWLDAASALRMQDDAVIILDPVNRNVIDRALDSGVRTYVGGNCTVSLMLMGLIGLFRENLVEWANPTTYQAASGGGARHMRELLQQMGRLHGDCRELLDDPASAILDIDQKVIASMHDKDFPVECFSTPLAGSVIPWIDSLVANGQTREEWKAGVEANKILGNSQRPIPIDGLCVRVGAMRSHSQSVTVKLKKGVSVRALEDIIASGNEWVEVIDNTPEATRAKLTPAYASGSLQIPVGRIRKLSLGDDYLSLFTVGDQLLWGAAEPLRRMLAILVGRL